MLNTKCFVEPSHVDELKHTWLTETKKGVSKKEKPPSGKYDLFDGS